MCTSVWLTLITSNPAEWQSVGWVLIVQTLHRKYKDRWPFFFYYYYFPNFMIFFFKFNNVTGSNKDVKRGVRINMESFHFLRDI